MVLTEKLGKYKEDEYRIWFDMAAQKARIVISVNIHGIAVAFGSVLSSRAQYSGFDGDLLGFNTDCLDMASTVSISCVGV